MENDLVWHFNVTIFMIFVRALLPPIWIDFFKILYTYIHIGSIILFGDVCWMF